LEVRNQPIAAHLAVSIYRTAPEGQQEAKQLMVAAGDFTADRDRG
jgi:hypothetical protein